MKAYYDEAGITIYHGDCREVLPSIEADVVITDPPYGETSLPWDRVVPDWIPLVHAPQMWIFGSLRSLLDLGPELAAADWKLAQDIVWEKHNGSGLAADRFRRVHELVAHFYRGMWSQIPKQPQLTADATPRTVRRKAKPAQWQGARGPSIYASHDGGPRLTIAKLAGHTDISHTDHYLGDITPAEVARVPDAFSLFHGKRAG